MSKGDKEEKQWVRCPMCEAKTMRLYFWQSQLAHH